MPGALRLSLGALGSIRLGQRLHAQLALPLRLALLERLNNPRASVRLNPRASVLRLGQRLHPRLAILPRLSRLGLA